MTRFVLKAITAAVAVTATLGAVDTAAQTKYSAEVRRTSFGIAHIKANEFGSIGYGVGYVTGQDNICAMADEFVTVRGERARYFGPTGTSTYGRNNLFSDYFYTYFNGDPAPLRAGLAKMSPESQAAFRGWVAGYNRYLRDTGVANLPAPCRGAAWVRPIDDVDMMRLVRRITIEASSGAFVEAIPATQPPAAAAAGQEKSDEAWSGVIDPDWLREWNERQQTLGSNALALGSDGTDNRRGMLLGTPHFPWLGVLRFMQFHVTVPGQMDSMGAALWGVPFPLVGFNKDVAWSHTVDTTRHFTLFKLRLDPASPLKYVYDGQTRDMTARTVTVQVLQPNGALVPVPRTIYSTHLGPLVSIPPAGLTWTRTNAYAIKDANLDNWRIGDQWYDFNRATSTRDLEVALERHLGVPWVNTTAADRDGMAFYADITAAPNVDRFHQSVCTPDATALGVFAVAGIVVLDGTKSSCDWPVDPSTPVPGIMPAKLMPRLYRTDFTHNANDSYWLTNPAVNMYSWYIPAVVGVVPAQQNMRTQIGVAQALARLSGADQLGGDKFTLPLLQQIALSNRSLAADLYLPDMVTLCGTPAAASVQDLCAVLRTWDRKFELSSRGGHLFREFFLTARFVPNVFAVPYDQNNPLTTPRGFAISNPTVSAALVNALAAAGKRITDAGLRVDAPLGTIQFGIQALLSGGRTIVPIHGNAGTELGVYNAIGSTLQPNLGYIVTNGTSYIQTVQFTDTGVNAQAFLTYSQSSNPASPNFADQTARFSAKQWITLPFTEAAITSDPGYRTSTISE